MQEIFYELFENPGNFQPPEKKYRNSWKQHRTRMCHSSAKQR